MTQAYLGADIAKATIDLALLTAEGKLRRQHVGNNERGFEKLVAWLHGLGLEPGQVHVCLESTGPYGQGLAMHLHARQHLVSVVNPAAVAAYGKSEMRRNKTDRYDALLLARFCRDKQPRPFVPLEAAQEQLRVLSRRLETLETTITQERDRLEKGGGNELVAASINRVITVLQDEVARVKELMAETVSQSETLKRTVILLDSIKGIGLKTAVKLAAELEPVQHFQSVSQFDAFYGLSPVNCTSGSSVHRKTKMSKQGSARVRKALYMPAIAAKRCNPMVRDLCNRLSSKKLASMAIIVAAMRKLLHQVFGVLKTGRPFDPNYVASRS